MLRFDLVIETVRVVVRDVSHADWAGLRLIRRSETPAVPRLPLVQQVGAGSPEDTPHRGWLRDKALNAKESVLLVTMFAGMMIKDPPVRDSHHDQTPYR